jgi:hypothetical protein
LTVCMASLCEGGSKIITVTDRLLSFGQSGVDGGLEKNSPLHPNWFAMYSADDVSDVRPIIDRAAILMCAGGKQRFLTEAGDILSNAFAFRHQQLIDHRVMVPNGFDDMGDFDRRAKDCLTTREYNYIRRQMRATKPQCELLVGGFDPVGMGHLFVQDSTGPWQGYDDPGWRAIGCGAQEAFTALQFQADKLGFGLDCWESECTYHLLSAKFMAESNRFVGPKTFVSCHSFNSPVRYMYEGDIGEIRKAWEKCGIPRLPQGIIRKIPKMFETCDETRLRGERFKEIERKLFGKAPIVKAARTQ